MPHQTPRRFLCLWLPNWPAQRAQRDDAQLAGRPVAVCERDARTEVVIACSPEAARLGVSIGMRTPDAQGLAGPRGLVTIAHRATADRRALEKLAVACERFSPTVALNDCEAPDALLLDVTGLAPLWTTGERGLAEAALRWAGEQELRAVVAVAPTISMALAGARWLAAHGDKPLLIPAERCLEAASRLPIEALPLEPPTLAGLRALGVDTVGRLIGLPRSGLPARFGRAAPEQIDQLLGERAQVLASFRGEPPLSAAWEFEVGVSSPGAIERVRRQLLDQLAAQMARRRVGALGVLVEHTLDACGVEPLGLTLRLLRPTTSPRELEELIGLRLEGQRLPHPVSGVRVTVGATAPVAPRQQTLFDNDRRDNPHELGMLVNRLASLLGDDAVLRVHKQRSVDPGRAFSTQPAAESPARAYPLSPREAARLRRLPLLHDPQPTEATDLEFDPHGRPCGVAGRGARVVGRGARKVARSWGPERIETGWWRGQGLRRDAYWVELEDGARLWLCRDLRGDCWLVGGEL